MEKSKLLFQEIFRKFSEAKSMEEKEVNPFCRLCLSTSIIYYSLLKNNGKEMLFSLTGITVNEDCPYSTESCVKCWLDLKSAYRIQQRFAETEKKFQLTGLQGIESRLELASKKNQSESIEDLANISSLATVIKVETEEDEPENEDTANNDNVSEHDLDYSELIYIQTDDDSHAVEQQPNCFICGIKCENDTALYSHTNSHYNEEQPCDACLTNFPNIATYRDHIEARHPEMAEKTYCCGICPLSFRYMSLYDLHMAAVHPETAKTNKKKNRDVSQYLPNGDKFKCEDCNKCFKSKKSYNTHVKGRIKKPCPICGAKITVYNLSKHITNHEAKPAVCHLCGITTKHLESLRGHIFNTHSEKRLKCETCGRIFKKLYAYKMHIKKEHTGERSFTCDACGKRFFTNYELNKHTRSRHLKERKHICQYCKRGFASRFSMRTHERQHTNEAPYVCEVCGEGFRQNVSLRAHRKSKHNIVESKKAECSICGKMFRDDWALKSHIRSVHD